MYTEATAAKYLEYMIHQFYDGLLQLREFNDLTDDEMETTYALGYNLFVYGMYEESKEVFTGLTTHAPHTAHYWRAFGAVNQQLQDYAKAVEGYDMAIANDELDIVSYVYRGESQILAGNIAEGIAHLEAAAAIGAAFPEFAAWVDRARLLIDVHRP